MSVKRIMQLTAIALYGFFMGFGTGRRLPAPQYIFNAKSVLAINRIEVWNTLIKANATLANCLAFRKTYPSRHKYFLQYIAKHDIGVGYDPIETCCYAYTKLLNTTIWLTNDFFAQSSLEQERTLAHEMLHIVGFPDHASTSDWAHDQIYLLTDACYPDLPKEAL